MRLLTGRRVAGIVLHEQRFVFIIHKILLREPLSIVDVAPSREGVGAYRTTHLIPLGMAQASRLGPCRWQHIGRSSHVPPPQGRTPRGCSSSAETLQFGGDDQQKITSAFRCDNIIADFDLYINIFFRYLRKNIKCEVNDKVMKANSRFTFRKVCKYLLLFLYWV